MPREAPGPVGTVFVVDDDPAMRDALGWLLRSAGHTVEAFPSAEAFLAADDPERPGCLVLDVRMPGMDGLALQAALNARGASRPAVILTGHADVALAVQAVKAGAVDFLEKPFDDAVLLARVAEALAADDRLRVAQAEREAVRDRLAALTPREQEVLELIVAGHANKEIAAVLGVSPRTVEVHRARVMEKTGAQSVAELVRLVLAAGD
jgi:RNA polymerase sigma factor (sigma-70 family)